MSNVVLVSIQHEKSKKCTCKTDTQLPKKENNITNDVHLSNPKDVTDNEISCNLRRLKKAFSCYCNLQSITNTIISDAVKIITINLDHV